MTLHSKLASLAGTEKAPLLKGIVRGIEKESLRVSPDGHLAKTAHPSALGSALTHPSITTDYSEALLEFITSPSNSIDQVLEELDEIHRFTYQHIDDELLWVSSMPCQLGDDSSIPVGKYGSSNIGRMKTFSSPGSKKSGCVCVFETVITLPSLEIIFVSLVPLQNFGSLSRSEIISQTLSIGALISIDVSMVAIWA